MDYSECLSKQQKDDGKSYAECPVVCHSAEKKYDLQRTEPCRNCPRQKHWKAFKVDTEELWGEWFGEGHEFRFEPMLESLYRISALEDVPPDRLSVKSSALLRVFKREREKADRRRAKN